MHAVHDGLHLLADPVEYAHQLDRMRGIHVDLLVGALFAATHRCHPTRNSLPAGHGGERLGNGSKRIRRFDRRFDRAALGEERLQAGDHARVDERALPWHYCKLLSICLSMRSRIVNMFTGISA